MTEDAASASPGADAAVDAPEPSPTPPDAAAASAPHPDAAAAGERRDTRLREAIEIAAAIVLGLAAVLTAWSAYQTVIMSSASLQAFTQSQLTAVETEKWLGSGDQQYTEDLVVFIEYAKAQRAGETDLAVYLKGLMGEELVKAIDWWEAQPEPRPDTPFVDGSPVMDNAYYQEEARLAVIAQDQFEKGQKTSAMGDQFTLSTVLYAVVLFFAGIAAASRRTRMAGIALAMSVTFLVVATVHLVTTQLSL